MDPKWLEILEKVKSGEVSVADAEQSLGNMNQPAGHAESVEVFPKHSPEEEEAAFNNRLKEWRRWWLYPFVIGLVIVVIGASLMTWGYSSQLLFWVSCSWVPLVLGVVILSAAAWSSQARWVHVRVKDPQENSKVSISLPIPLGLASLSLRLFGSRIPPFKDQDLNAVLPALDILRKNHDPIVVEVNEKNGEQVQVYII